MGEHLDLRGSKWREAGEDCIMRSFITCTPYQTLLGELYRRDEMGSVSSTHGRHENCIQNFSRKPEGKRPLGRPRRRYELDSSD